jgi:hypothetical protein
VIDVATRVLGPGKLISVLRRGKLSGLDFNRGSIAGSSNSLGSQFSRIFISAYMQMAYNLRALQPCLILGLKCSVNILEEDVVEILITGISHPSPPFPDSSRSLQGRVYGDVSVSPITSDRRANPGGVPRRRSGSLDDILDGKAGDWVSPASRGDKTAPLSNPQTPVHRHGSTHRARSFSLTSQSSSNEGSEGIASSSASRHSGSPRAQRTVSPSLRGEPFTHPIEQQSIFGYDGPPVEPLLDPNTVFLTPLPSVPGAVVTKYLGPIHLHFVKDSENTRAVGREEGATEQFFFLFLSEASAVARAQVEALGGNALLGYKILMQEGGRGSSSSSGNRAGTSGLYNMVTISGDAVTLEQDPSHCQSYWEAIHSKEMQRRGEWLPSQPQEKVS